MVRSMRSKKASKPAEVNVMDLLREKGEKAIIGLEGYYQLGRSRGDSPWFVPIRLKGIVMKGCTPNLVAEPIGGVGELRLENPCQFIPSKEDIARRERVRIAKEARDADSHKLRGGYNRLITDQTYALQRYVFDVVPGGAEHPKLKEHLERDGLSPEKLKFEGRHLNKYQEIVLEIVHGPEGEEPEFDEED